MMFTRHKPNPIGRIRGRAEVAWCLLPHPHRRQTVTDTLDLEELKRLAISALSEGCIMVDDLMVVYVAPDMCGDEAISKASARLTKTMAPLRRLPNGKRWPMPPSTPSPPS